MSLSEEEVRRIAKLARIKLSDPELATTQTALNRIFDLLARLQETDTTGVIPMSHAQDVSLRTRADCVTEINQRDAFQHIAPQVEQGLYLVPKVIE